MDGPAEAGKVTSLVRYDAGARFPERGHPGGEEILVLEGIFSDQHGHYGKGWHLLNPSDSRHESYSENGCLLLVKLRQYSGKDTIHQDTGCLDWEHGKTNGVSSKLLYENHGPGISIRLVRIEKTVTAPFQTFAGGQEIYVVDGSLEDEFGVHRSGSWLRYPPDGGHCLTSQGGACFIFRRVAWPSQSRSKTLKVRLGCWLRPAQAPLYATTPRSERRDPSLLQTG